jgi:Flavodoxin
VKAGRIAGQLGGAVMKTVIVYESMYGNTHAIAEAIGEGLSTAGEVTVVPVADAGQHLLGQADLVVVGGPTHAHGMSRAATRKGAADAARKTGQHLDMDPAVDSGGIRDWLAALSLLDVPAAAFDTRMNGPAVLTGRASKGIASLLRGHGCTVVADPESFLVTKRDELYPGEKDRARQWGASLAAKAAARPRATRK